MAEHKSSEPKKPSAKDAVMAERKANTARRAAALEAEGYRREDATVSILKANLMTFVTALPLIVVVILATLALHRGAYQDGLAKAFYERTILHIVLMIVSIPVHEGLHGLGWRFFCKEGWRSIQFGVMWESLTPYAHCREPLKLGRYYIGLLAPVTVLGVVPSILAVVTGDISLLLMGTYNLLLAGGDLTIALIIARYRGKDVRILDHPDQCGAVAFVKET